MTTSENRNRTIDLLDYIRGRENVWHQLSTGEHITTRDAGNGSWLIQKNENWEHMAADDSWIYRGLDTSESPTRFYIIGRNDYFETRQTKNPMNYGGTWIRRYMSVGQTVSSEQWVTHYHRGNPPSIRMIGAPVYQYRLSAINQGWHGLDNVAELQWIVSGAVQETYYYAKGIGFVGWNNNHYTGPSGPSPKPLLTMPAGYNYNELNFNLNAAPTPTPEGEFVRATIVAVHSSGQTNVRPTPGTGQPPLGTIQAGDQIEVDRSTLVSNWRRIRWNGQTAWVGGKMSVRLEQGGGSPTPTPSLEERIRRLETSIRFILENYD